MEILSPASNMEHIKVAIDEKTDAVYGGLSKWNARNKAINFSTEEYNFLIKKLHKNNIKFYLTLNILLLDSEIEEVIEFLKNNSLPDSFIVTDIGLILRLQEEFPNVPLHFSTQFGAHNIDDINFIKSLNGERAIISRELTLKEIEKIKNKSNIELECFIWGSQCLSFSGLCFFGTLINGGGGNRGKCIITCRDIYSINNELGNYLYVPDMDCINLISKLDGINCLKLEGRRRKPNEIEGILNQIRNGIPSNRNAGYLFGTDVNDNHLYEKINYRIKPFIKASELTDINDCDICVKYKNQQPICFSKEYENPDVMYIYTEFKKKYNIRKKNLCFDFVMDGNSVVNEVLYMNYKGDGHTFLGNNQDLIEINLELFVKTIENQNKKINIYKIKYRRNNNKIFINRFLYNDIIDYILSDCKEQKHHITSKDFSLKSIYLDTNNLTVVDEFIDDPFVNVIFDIATINNLKNIERIVDKYGDRIIYKLPIFNWKSENILPYLKMLKDKEVMFTRFTQIFLCKKIKFKKRYTDYTVYIWNKRTLEYLKKNSIDEFTASPELSYEKNKAIFGSNLFQVIIGGTMPLVYTRNCFKHLYGCINCVNNQHNSKKIKNVDKNLDFNILCNDDYRYILNSDPILNNYSKVKTTAGTKYRYICLGHTIEQIKESIACFKEKNYYDALINKDTWKNSYECNLIEGKE